MYTDAYNILLSKRSLDPYISCLDEFVRGVVTAHNDNIYSIILFGGLVRDPVPIPEWSDIDLIIIFFDMYRRDSISLARIQNDVSSRYSIRIDLTQVSLPDIEDKALLRSCMNSELINALSMRENVSVVLYGAKPTLVVPKGQEKLAAIFYMNNTLILYRRFLVETVFLSGFQNVSTSDLPRAIRWTFSVVRASLRLFDIYTHPYDYSLPYIRTLFPSIDLTLLCTLLKIRNSYPQVLATASVFQDIERFLEHYIVMVLRKYYSND